MDNQKKSAMVRIPVIILAFSAMLLSASPCLALLEIPLPGGETTLDVDYPIYDDVAVYTGGTLNLLDGGVINCPINEWVIVNAGGTLNLLDGSVINGAVSIGDGGTLNIEGGHVNGDVFVAGGSEVKIKGGDIEGDIYPWDITVGAQAKLTVFGTDFDVTNGTIDQSGTYFTPYPGFICRLTGEYGGDAGDIDLQFYVYFPDIHIFLAPPDSEVIEVIIDIKPGSKQNNINLKSKGVVPVAVLTADGFFADTIDPDTALFAGAEPKHWSFKDVDDDGDVDVIFHFRTQKLALDQNSTEATLTAQLSTGEEVFGIDKVRIVQSKK